MNELKLVKLSSKKLGSEAATFRNMIYQLHAEKTYLVGGY
jgi:hypothetical protein